MNNSKSRKNKCEVSSDNKHVLPCHALEDVTASSERTKGVIVWEAYTIGKEAPPQHSMVLNLVNMLNKGWHLTSALLWGRY